MSHINFNHIVNAEDYILQTLHDYNIIGFGEGAHGLENSHHFLLKMFDNQKIQETIDIVIVEFANTDYQHILDKYIFGDDINLNELSNIWRESTQSPGRLGDIPVYFELLKKIRGVNLTLSLKNKIRVVGGDPSINWNTINTLNDYKDKIGFKRDTFPAQLAIDFAINDLKKVLLIYSGFHLTKVFDKTLAHPTITTTINKQYKDLIKVIEVLNPATLQLEEQVKDLPLYSMIDLSKNEIGNLPAEKMFSSIVNNKGERLSLFDGYTAKDLFDAFIFVGLTTSWKIADIPKDISYDNEYWDELNRRRQIVGMKPLAKTTANL